LFFLVTLRKLVVNQWAITLEDELWLPTKYHAGTLRIPPNVSEIKSLKESLDEENNSQMGETRPAIERLTEKQKILKKIETIKDKQFNEKQKLISSSSSNSPEMTDETDEQKYIQSTEYIWRRFMSLDKVHRKQIKSYTNN
jgi:hypothetical protein